MKTILKAGNPASEPIKQEKCPRCGCEFTFDPRVGFRVYGGNPANSPGDVTYSTNSGVPYGDPYVVCPQEGCGFCIPAIAPETERKLKLLKEILSSLPI